MAEGRTSLPSGADLVDGTLRLTLGNGLAAIADSGAAVAEFCAFHALTPTVVNRIEVIFEEVVANIIRHGLAAGSPQSIRVAMTFEANRAGGDVVLRFDDDGAPFDPVKAVAPPAFTRLADAAIGGLGIALVKRLARKVTHERPALAGGIGFQPVNRLTVRVATG